MTVETLADLLASMDGAGERGVTFADDGGADQRYTYPEFAAAVRRVAGRLFQGVGPGQPIAIISSDCRVQSTVFWACAAWGRVASILPAPSLLIAGPYYARVVPAMLGALSPARLVTDRVTLGRLERAVPSASLPGNVVLFEQLLESGPASPEAPVTAATRCYIQFSSGTTSAPKGVVLTHGSIVANLRAMTSRLRATADDVGLSWLPLYHDMGLVGGHLIPAFSRMEQILMRPLSFAGRPHTWLERLSSSKATLAVAPGFAYDQCLSRGSRQRLSDGVDLSRVRAMLNGSEPIRPDGPKEFEETFAELGLRPGTVVPCYGLAEATLAVTICEPGQRARVDTKDGTRAICVGEPLDGVSVRIVDGEGSPLPDGTAGEIAASGPGLADGYLLEGPFLSEGWLRTGDLGYLRDGALYVTGRAKDILVVRGRNVDPGDLEDAADEVKGVRPGHTVAFPVLDAASGREQVVLLFEPLESGPDDLAASVRSRVGEATGITPDLVLAVPRATITRTTSGKKMRQPAKAWYLQNHR